MRFLGFFVLSLLALGISSIVGKAIFGTDLSYQTLIPGIIFAASINFGIRIMDGWMDAIALPGISKKEIDEARKLAERYPEKAKPSWDYATKKLEAYIGDNQKQNRKFFLLGYLMLILGFGLIVTTIYLSFQQSSSVSYSLVAGIGGVLTEFIGTVILSFYKSSLDHSVKFIQLLDKTSSLGIAVQVLDEMSNTSIDEILRAKAYDARIEILKLFIGKIAEK